MYERVQRCKYTSVQCAVCSVPTAPHRHIPASYCYYCLIELQLPCGSSTTIRHNTQSYTNNIGHIAHEYNTKEVKRSP
jgi:hypothetical protein